MTPRVAGPTAEVLERGRDRPNAAFLAARRAGAAIDPDAFLGHVAGVVTPVVDAVAAERPERAAATLDALFAVSLELFGSSALGPCSTTPAVAAVWTRLLPALPGLVARDPRRVAASLSNAAFNVARAAGARPDAWVDDLCRLGPACPGVRELLECGKVAAWRAGLAQYRVGAIAAARGLPAPLAASALGLPDGTAADAVAGVLDRLADDPWLPPDAATNPGPQRLRLVARAGAFRGFGGEFLRPPRVWASSGRIGVADGEASWTLFADRYGRVLVRGDAGPPDRARPPATVDARGTVAWDGERATFPSLAGASTFACDGRTLAVAVPTSHHVFLVARIADGPAEGASDAA